MGAKRGKRKDRGGGKKKRGRVGFEPTTFILKKKFNLFTNIFTEQHTTNCDHWTIRQCTR